MDRIRCGCLIAGLLIAVLLLPVSSRAQFTASYQTNIISGVTSNWAGDYVVGTENFISPMADVLLIQNGGVLTNSGRSQNGFSLGGTSSNSVLITDPGSALLLPNTFLSIGFAGTGNNLVVSNGGKLVTSSMMASKAEIDGPNSILVTGDGSVWSNSYQTTFIGQSVGGVALAIRNGGLVVNAFSPSIFSIGEALNPTIPCTNNTLLVADPGSVLNNGSLVNVGIGLQASGNSMVISNGGVVFDRNGIVGSSVFATNNSVQVIGSGSVWSNFNALTIGSQCPSNSLLIAVGGKVFDASATVGSGGNGNSNTAQVTTGSLWQNGALMVGSGGSSNSLVINGGSVSATSLAVGSGSPTCDNLVELGSGSLIITNNGTGVLQVQGGQLTLNGGVLQADILQFTGSCASFVHTGGTLIVSSVIVDPNFFKIVSVTPQSNGVLVTWLMGPGATNALQVTSGDANGNYTTNTFADIFIVTNNTMTGTLTNFLDLGAATNRSRYYRARLSP